VDGYETSMYLTREESNQLVNARLPLLGIPWRSVVDVGVYKLGSCIWVVTKGELGGDLLAGPRGGGFIQSRRIREVWRKKSKVTGCKHWFHAGGAEAEMISPENGW